MKSFVINCLPAILIIAIVLSCEQNTTNQTTADPTIEAQSVLYDSLKAREYGADDYGMKKYVMAFLKKGPNRDLDSLTAAKLQMAHLQNITKMAEAGQLVLAGPFFGDGELRGIYIFNVETIAEAEALTNSDPAIQAGSLVMDLKEWYGSAGLMAINEIHASLAKKGILEEGE